MTRADMTLHIEEVHLLADTEQWAQGAMDTRRGGGEVCVGVPVQEWS